MLDYEWKYPVLSLNDNISATLGKILKDKSHLFRNLKKQKCSNLLKSQINICDERGWRGQVMCEYDENTNEVTLSASFCQMVWLLCYVALAEEDYRITEEEFSKFPYLAKIKELAIVSWMYKHFPKKLHEKERYIHVMRKTYEGGKHIEAVALASLIASHKPVDEEIAKRLEALFEKNDFCCMVNSLYLYAVCFYLLHEYGHYVLGGESLDELMEEYAADAESENLLLKKTGNYYLKSSMYGMTAGLCCLMFFSLKNDTHPDTDLRLKAVLERFPVTDNFRRKNAGMILTFLRAWSVWKGLDDFPKREEENLEALDRAFDYIEKYKKQL
jgi:hypothetical protein